MDSSPALSPHVHLRAGGDRRILRGCPWVFSNEIRMDADARALPAGTMATLHRVDGKPQGIGIFNPHALIAFRMLDRDHRTPIDTGFFVARLERALRLRERLFDRPFYRLVHAEADGLPGVIIDRFADCVVVQVNTAGMERRAEDILKALDEVVDPAIVVLRNDTRARGIEGLAQEVRLTKGRLDGPIEVLEDRCVFSADPMAGQKTGWFFDQRANRRFAAPLAAGGAALDLYCYSGGFAIAAAAAGATTVTGVDSSESALSLARRSAATSAVADRCTFHRSDVLAWLDNQATPARYRLVVADPPAFVKSRKDLKVGLKAYRKLAQLAARRVEAGGFLLLASCSHNVGVAEFAAEVAAGIQRAGRTGRVLRTAGAGPDHPVHPHLPETAYLKTMLLQLD